MLYAFRYLLLELQTSSELFAVLLLSVMEVASGSNSRRSQRSA